MDQLTLINQLKTKAQRIQILAISLPLAMIALALFILLMMMNQVKTVGVKRQQLAVKLQTVKETQAFNQYVETNQVKLDRLNHIIPNEAMMISVISDFESIIAAVDSLGTVKIASTNPVKSGLYSSVSIAVTFSSPIENLPAVLEKLNSLPYLTQLISLDTNQVNDSYNHQLMLRLYVQEPFSNP